MTIHVVKLTGCPYCPHNGDIFVNVPKLLCSYDLAGRELSLNEEPAQSLLIFNSDGADPIPCPHLLGILGHCNIGPSDTNQWSCDGQELSFSWWNERMEQDGVGAYFFHYLMDPVTGQALGDIAACEEEFHCRWSAGDNKPGKLWHVYGSVYFAKDVSEIVAETSTLVEA